MSSLAVDGGRSSERRDGGGGGGGGRGRTCGEVRTERGVVGRSVNVADVSLCVCPILSPPRKSIEEEDGIWQRERWLVLVRFGQAN
jgi:hypothetical protein